MQMYNKAVSSGSPDAECDVNQCNSMYSAVKAWKDIMKSMTGKSEKLINKLGTVLL